MFHVELQTLRCRDAKNSVSTHNGQTTNSCSTWNTIHSMPQKRKILRLYIRSGNYPQSSMCKHRLSSVPRGTMTTVCSRGAKMLPLYNWRVIIPYVPRGTMNNGCSRDAKCCVSTARRVAIEGSTWSSEHRLL